MLIFENFISRYENFKYRDSSSTRKSKRNAALGVDDALNAWMLQHSRYDAAQPWLGGGPWEVDQRTGSCGGVKFQSAPVSLMYTCLVRPDRQTAVIPDSSHAVAVIAQQWTAWVALTGWAVSRVYSLKWFSKSWSVTDAVLIRRRIQRALCWMTPRPLGLPTDTSHVAGEPPLPNPLTY